MQRNRNVFVAQGFRVSTTPVVDSQKPAIYFRIRRGTLSAVGRNAFKRLVRQKLRPYHYQFLSHVIFHVGRSQVTAPWEKFIKGVQNDLEQFLQNHAAKKTSVASVQADRALWA